MCPSTVVRPFLFLKLELLVFASFYSVDPRRPIYFLARRPVGLTRERVSNRLSHSCPRSTFGALRDMTPLRWRGRVAHFRCSGTASVGV